jgi:glucose/arabinose dehydrogenase
MCKCAILLLVLAVATTGCATAPRPSAPQPQDSSAPQPQDSSAPQPQPQPQPRVNLSGYSAAFKQGYADGCDSARSLLTRKDGRRFQSDGDYAMGWKDGHSICERRGK